MVKKLQRKWENFLLKDKKVVKINNEYDFNKVKYGSSVEYRSVSLKNWIGTIEEEYWD
jgi:hypothetical protein